MAGGAKLFAEKPQSHLGICEIRLRKAIWIANARIA
jgi:hypothetical protein